MKYILSLLLIFSVADNYAQTIPSVKMDDVIAMIDSSTTPLVINFWASWCIPCIKEIPGFERQIKLNENVKLILVSLDFNEDYPGRLQSFVNKNKYSSEILWLNETDADSFCPKIDAQWQGAIPATLFVNRAKNYRKFVGVELSETRFEKEIGQLIK